MTSEFQGKQVVVTGGTGALGAAVVAKLIERGAVCHVPVWDRAELEGFPDANSDRVRLVTDLDLRDEAQTAGFYEALPSLWASIQIAGGFSMGPIESTALEEYERLMQMNARTCFLCCREAAKRIRASSKGGRIVNVSAKPALEPTGGMVAYAASKAAVASITLSLAEELRADGIWVNAIVPSIMDTPANRAAMPDADFSSWPSVEGVAETITFLASPRNDTTRGALVPVYGRA